MIQQISNLCEHHSSSSYRLRNYWYGIGFIASLLILDSRFTIVASGSGRYEFIFFTVIVFEANDFPLHIHAPQCNMKSMHAGPIPSPTGLSILILCLQYSHSPTFLIQTSDIRVLPNPISTPPMPRQLLGMHPLNPNANKKSQVSVSAMHQLVPLQPSCSTCFRNQWAALQRFSSPTN